MRRPDELSEVTGVTGACHLTGYEYLGNQIRCDQGDEFGGKLLSKGFEGSRMEGDIRLIVYTTPGAAGRRHYESHDCGNGYEEGKNIKDVYSTFVVVRV